MSDKPNIRFVEINPRGVTGGAIAIAASTPVRIFVGEDKGSIESSTGDAVAAASALAFLLGNIVSGLQWPALLQ